MVLLLHIIIAVTSVLFAGYMSFFPSNNKLKGTYILTLLTLASGTYLIILNPSHMISACFSGLFYIGLVTIGILITRKKLTKSTIVA